MAAMAAGKTSPDASVSGMSREELEARYLEVTRYAENLEKARMLGIGEYAAVKSESRSMSSPALACLGKSDSSGSLTNLAMNACATAPIDSCRKRPALSFDAVDEADYANEMFGPMF